MAVFSTTGAPIACAAARASCSSLTIRVARAGRPASSSNCIDSCSSGAPGWRNRSRQRSRTRSGSLRAPAQPRARRNRAGRAGNVHHAGRPRARRARESPRAWQRRSADRRPCRGVRDQERGLARGGVSGAQIVEIARVDTAAGDAIVDHRAECGAGIGHQRCKAALHADVVLGSASAPRIERVDGRQSRIEQRLEAADALRRQLREAHASRVCAIDQQLPLTAGIVDRDEPAAADGMRLREHDQRRRELLEIVDTMDAVAIEQRLVAGILARNRPGVRDGQPRRELGTADLDRDHRDAAGVRLFERVAVAPRDCAPFP